MDTAHPLTTAYQLLAQDMARFEETLQRALAPQQPYLSETEYDLYRRGKKLRPLLLLLSARLTAPAGVVLPEKVIRAAVSLEMLHVATLIHDDIVDAAPTRRGLRTVYSARGTDMAILIGDLQFVQAIRCFSEGIDTQRDMQLVQLVLDTGFQICCGEIDEMTTNPNWSPEVLERRYYRTVDRKTAVLFGLACEAGVSLMGGGARATYAISRFGRRMGRAFQIIDDLIDLMAHEEAAGKRPGADIRQRRFSLPIIYALSELHEGHILHHIMKGGAYTDQHVADAVRDIILSKGFFRAYAAAKEAMLEGLAYLQEFPDNIYRQTLAEIAMYVVDHYSGQT